jgi:serine/threonine protein kinase
VLLTLDDCHRNLTDSEGKPLKLLHGDIRPSRVFLDGGHARLTGFGAPFEVRPERLLWLPPEALEGRVVTEQSDVYQVGVLLYEALTGVLPFRAQTAHQLLAAIVDGPRPISSFNPSVPRSIDSLVRRALSFSPSGRPASAQAFAQTLARIDLNAPLTPMELVSPVAEPIAETPIGEEQPPAVELTKTISLPGPLKRGDRIGRYEIIGKLNAGGMSELFIAKSAQHPWPMVLKTLIPSLLNDADATMMFMNEARLLSEVEHSNIVRVTDVGFDHQRPFMAMEYFPGRPLAEVLTALEKEGRFMPPHLATFIIAEAAAGLECTHTRRGADGRPLHIVHRDVTSRNLLVGYRGHVKVIDFGLARSLGMDRLTSPGHVRGNAPWVAPEQVMGKPLTAATDVWALGVNLYLMLTGKLPFDGETPFEVLQRVLETEPVGVRRLRAEVPEAIAELLPRALAKSMVERYPSAGDLREDALQILSDVDDAAKELGDLMESLFPRRTDPERLRVSELAGETVMPKDAPSPLRRLMGWFKEVSS